MPVIDFILGKITEKEMHHAAEKVNDSTRKAEQLCVISFYVAEAKLIQGNITDAVAGLSDTQKVCPTRSFVFHSATTELRRVGKQS